MPHLLSLNSYHYRRGGSDVVYFEHEALFASLGWQTAHLSMKHPKNLPSLWSEFFVDEIELGHSYGLLQKAVMAGKVVYSLEARRRLSALLERFPADIAHVHCIYHHLSPSVLPLLRERGIPVVLTAHDLKLACPAYKMLNRGAICERCKGGNLLHLVANRCVHGSLAASTVIAVESTVARLFGLWRHNLDRIVVPSRYFEQKLQEWGWPAPQLVYIPNYVDAATLQPDPAPGDYLLYFGRLASEKGLRTLVRAAIETGLPLRVAGTGPLESDLRALAAGHPNVQFLGFVSGAALWNLVRGSLAVVLPSEGPENAPMSLLEAGALGKPVIGANIGGIPELLIEGETGFAFEAGNVQALAEVLRHVHGLPRARLHDMGVAARRHVETTFTRERYRDAMLSLYASLGAGGSLAKETRDGRAD
ncbi:MAG: glycosyltransferase family 4 protein [Rubrivivax sp.]|nr:glycosyltransferase family 4 protein [Rubrivivax sp.]